MFAAHLRRAAYRALVGWVTSVRRARIVPRVSSTLTYVTVEPVAPVVGWKRKHAGAAPAAVKRNGGLRGSTATRRRR